MTAVLRRHMPPPRTNFETLQDILAKRRGMELDVSSSGALAASLDHCVDKSDPTFNTLVRIMATRCMLSAEYFCSGSVAGILSAITFGCGHVHPFHISHSTLRDVLAHRQLAAAINYEPLTLVCTPRTMSTTFSKWSTSVTVAHNKPDEPRRVLCWIEHRRTQRLPHLHQEGRYGSDDASKRLRHPSVP